MKLRRVRTVALAAAASALALCLSPAAATASPVDTFPGQTVDPSGSWADSGPGFPLSGEVGEPDHDGNGGTPIQSAWYSWTPTVDTTVTIETCTFTSPTVDTAIAVYTGNSVDMLTLVPGTPADDTCGLKSRTRLAGMGGTTYRIAVDSKGTAAGTWAFYMNPTPANDDLAAAQPLASLPLASANGTTDGATREALEATHGGAAGGTSVWYSWIAPASGTAVAQTCGSSAGFDSLLSVYDGGPGYISLNSVAENDDGCGPLSTASFPVSMGTTYYIAVEGKDGPLEPGGDKGAFTLDVALPPANDNYAMREVLPAVDPAITWTGNNVAAGEEPGEGVALGHPGHSIWYEWTPPSSGPVTFSTCDSPDTVLTQVDLYTSTGAVPPFTNLTSVASDASGCPGGLQGSVTFNVVGGTPYSIAVSSAGAGGPIEFDIIDASTPPPPPPPPPPGGGTTTLTPVTTPVVPASSTVVTTTKKCKKGRKLKRGKCVKKKRK